MEVLQPYGEWVTIASDENEFVAAVECFDASNKPKGGSVFPAVSWVKRVDRLQEVIESL